MAQSVDMRPHMSAHRDGVGRRADIAREHNLAMLLRRPEQERRMRRVMGHAHEIWLSEIVNTRLLDLLKESGHPCRIRRSASRRAPVLYVRSGASYAGRRPALRVASHSISFALPIREECPQPQF